MSPLIRRFVLCGFAWAMVGAATGCVIPESDHPLSDEESSRPDDRLLGVWRRIAEEDEGDKPKEVFAVRKHSEKPNVFHIVVEEKEKGRAVIRRLPMYVTRIGGLQYFSLEGKDEPEEKIRYLILMYDFTEKDELRFYFPHHEVIADDIESGRLAGFVKRSEPDENDPNQKRDYKEIRITAPPDRLREYFKSQGVRIYQMSEPMRWRRTDPMKAAEKSG